MRDEVVEADLGLTVERNAVCSSRRYNSCGVQHAAGAVPRDRLFLSTSLESSPRMTVSALELSPQ
jgi:hypothetical protein